MNCFNAVFGDFLARYSPEVIATKEYLSRKQIQAFDREPELETISRGVDPALDNYHEVFIAQLRNSGYLILVNLDGHISAKALIEVGVAHALGIKVVSLEIVQDPNISKFCISMSEAFPGWNLKRVISNQTQTIMAHTVRHLRAVSL